MSAFALTNLFKILYVDIWKSILKLHWKKVNIVIKTWLNSGKRQRLPLFWLNQPKWNRPLTAVDPRRKLKLPPWAQTAPWSEWFKGGMLIRSRSIKLRKALCLGPKNNFPTLSPLSVLGGSGGGVCVCISMCACFSVYVCCAACKVDKFENNQLMGCCPN